MSESVQTTLEEAGRCPKCKEPGRHEGDRQLESARAKLKVFRCENARCKWHGETWIVQVNANGTIPPATLTRPKQFKPLEDDGGRTLRAVEKQLGLETGGGGELPQRYR